MTTSSCAVMQSCHWSSLCSSSSSRGAAYRGFGACPDVRSGGSSDSSRWLLCCSVVLVFHDYITNININGFFNQSPKFSLWWPVTITHCVHISLVYHTLSAMALKIILPRALPRGCGTAFPISLDFSSLFPMNLYVSGNPWDLAHSHTLSTLSWSGWSTCPCIPPGLGLVNVVAKNLLSPSVCTHPRGYCSGFQCVGATMVWMSLAVHLHHTVHFRPLDTAKLPS